MDTIVEKVTTKRVQAGFFDAATVVSSYDKNKIYNRL